MEVTSCELEQWFKHLYERLGWVVLAQSMGHTEKVEHYKKSIERFEEGLHNAQREIKDADRLRDLGIMAKKINVLKNHVQHDF